MAMVTRWSEGVFPSWMIINTCLNGFNKQINWEMIVLSKINGFFLSAKTLFICLYDRLIDSRREISDNHRTTVARTTDTPPWSWIDLLSPFFNQSIKLYNYICLFLTFLMYLTNDLQVSMVLRIFNALEGISDSLIVE